MRKLSEKSALFQRITNDITELNVRSAENGVEEALKGGVDPREIIERSLSEGLRIVGERYQEGEYFLSELIMSAEIARRIMERIEPELVSKRKEDIRGKVVIGTVRGDLHDIGKNLVAAFLKPIGLEVYDIGIDASPEKFVDAVERYKPDIVAMGALLTVCIPMYGETIEALEKAGLRKKLKILVGGGAANEQVARDAGADAYAENAWQAVIKARELLSGL